MTILGLSTGVLLSITPCFLVSCLNRIIFWFRFNHPIAKDVLPSSLLKLHLDEHFIQHIEKGTLRRPLKNNILRVFQIQSSSTFWCVPASIKGITYCRRI